MKRLIDFNSRFRILKGGKISLVVSALLSSSTLTFAAPTGGTVTSGSANISQSGKTTNIIQNTNKVSINWNKFNIAADEVVNFKQPNVNSIALNRVIGNEKSIINGALNANGQVWILNSNGVLFGKNAKINTAGLLATTKNLSDNDFNAGNYKFAGSSNESIINLGEIDITDSGYAVLLANSVSNEGTIKAVKGSVRLVGAKEVTINLNGNSLVNLTVNKGVLDSLVENKGAIYADGGEIYLTTNAVDELLKGVVNNEGVIEANSLDGVTGFVELFAYGGTANINGTIKAKGGFIETSGRELNVASSTSIEASKWLLDPDNMIIENTGGSSLTGASVSASAIQNALVSGDVELQADNDVTVNENIIWADTTKLTLTAGDEIYVNATIENTNDINGGVYFNAENTSDKVIFDTNGKVVINNVHQLQWINTALNGNYELGSDIDASDTVNWNGGKGFEMIGYPFTGKLDGKDYAIDSLYINRPTLDGTDAYTGFRVGMFFNLDNAEIRNLRMTNVDITGVTNAGALVGFAKGSILDNIHVSGSVSATQTNPINAVQVGGIAALMKDTELSNSSFSGDVNGANTVGGLVGNAQENSKIINSSSQGTNNATHTNGSNFGGLVGILQESSIRDSFSTMNINGGTTNLMAGGLVGQLSSSGSITNSYSTGAITGHSFLGGLVGWTSGTNDDIITISNSYFEGLLNTSGFFVGGLIGYSLNTQINDSHSIVSILKGTNSLGGLIGRMSNTQINNSYSKATINGNNSLGGLVGSTGDSTENNTGSSITDSYFEGTINASEYNIGGLISYANKLEIDNSYSKATITGTSAVGGILGYGQGSTTNDISITDSYFEGEIDASSDYIGGVVGYADNAIINSSHAKSSTISGDDQIGGLAGHTKNTTINDSYSKETTVTGNNYAGGLIGYTQDTTINDSYADTTVTGNNYVGGLVGILRTGEINRSYSKGTVSGDKYVAGLVGSGSSFSNNIIINDSYTEVDVTANEHSGGFIGWSRTADGYSTAINNSYANGKVNVTDTSKGHGFVGLHQTGTTLNISNSFWNTTKSGYANDKAGSQGLSASSMKDLNIFKNANWDIVEDSTMIKGAPALSWQVGKDGIGKPIWLIGTKVISKPIIDKPEVKTETINKLITPIVNKESITQVTLPQIKRLSAKNVNVSFNVGENKQIVSKPIEGQATKKVSMSQAKQMQEEATGQSVDEVKVPLSRSSQIVLVNGGVALPTGVEQEFYIAEDEI
ncbi:MAG: filamentous hemagglutinin N-terminal domain-containing protein [Campylobacteraceae bacterium]|nr:filamentous hemagglutinin N-terminal domain-containing protein [Campylobacteraceae bacterium]